MSQLPRYESYKDSGVQWLGEIPSHWKVTRLKFMAKIQNGSDYKHVQAEGGYPVIGSGGQFTYATEYLYKGESVLLGRKGTIDRPLYVNCAFWTVDTMYYTEIFNITFPKFLYYCTLTVDFWKYSTQTALPSMTQTALSNLMFATPEYAEQKIIADFLDKRLAQVDALIAKQETLLEKLAEQRVALISHAVTKGLNSDVEMKESGVELLGNIPNTWNVKRLKFLLSEKLKYGANESAESEDKENPRYIRITDIDDSGNLKDETFKSLESEKAQEYLLDDLDILLARSGATVGKSYLYKAESVGIACYAGYLIRARLDQENYDPEFVNYFLQSKQYWDWISSINIQATIQNVSAEKYNDLPLAIPPLEEQKQLIEYLKNEDEKFNSAIGKGQKLVQLLNEYRSTLITQVVTGKIDVRNLKVN